MAQGTSPRATSPTWTWTEAVAACPAGTADLSIVLVAGGGATVAFDALVVEANEGDQWQSIGWTEDFEESETTSWRSLQDAYSHSLTQGSCSEGARCLTFRPRYSSSEIDVAVRPIRWTDRGDGLLLQKGSRLYRAIFQSDRFEEVATVPAQGAAAVDWNPARNVIVYTDRLASSDVWVAERPSAD